MVSQHLGQILPNFKPILLAFDGKTTFGQGISIVVPRGSSIRASADLFNMTISTVLNSSAGCRLNRMLSTLEEQHIHIIHLEMDASLSSIMQQHVGASVMWEPYVSLACLQGAEPLLFEHALKEDYLTGIVAQNHWVQANEPVVTAYLKAHLRAHHIVRTSPVKASKIISQATGFPADVAAQLCVRIRWDAAAYDKDLKTLSRMAEPLPGALDFRGDYLGQASKQLKLPSLTAEPLAGDWSSQILY